MRIVFGSRPGWNRFGRPVFSHVAGFGCLNSAASLSAAWSSRRPQRRAARPTRAVAAVAQVELAAHRVAEQRAQVLVDVRLARLAAQPADVVEVVE